MLLRRRPCVLALLPLLAMGCSASIGVATFPGDDASALDAPLDAEVSTDALDVSDVSDVSDTPDTADVVDVPVDNGIREDCDTPFDDNGDGLVNENCPCMPAGSMARCFPADSSLFRGMCRFGVQTCLPTGIQGACVGAWAPLPLSGRPCEQTEVFSDTEITRVPVDIIWFVDTSSSMTRETATVNANLNRFASAIAASGLDYRVVMLARRGTGTLRVCVPPPLGGAACADGPRLRHVDRTIGSRDGLQQVISSYPLWRDFLRAGSARVFVAVTDDDSTLAADAFDTQLRALGGFDGYVFDSIVGYNNNTECPTLTRVGTQYLALTARTMGDQARVCDGDWSAIFTSFARGIASRVSSWALDSNARLDTLQVFIIAPDGTERRLLTGWHYDATTQRVTLDDEAIPPMGSHVRIVYRPLALSP